MKIMLTNVIAASLFFAASIRAQSLCDLLPASVVQSTLGITTSLSATPDLEGGNGCDYKGMAAGPVTILADTSDNTGLAKTAADIRFSNLGPGGQPISGLGDKAYYVENHGQQIPNYAQLTYTKQALVFVAKGKIVSFSMMLLNQGAPKANILALGKLALSKPIETLKDPK